MKQIGSKEDVLPDVLADNLYAVFCGSAASSHSAQTGHYYSVPGNRFWEILETAKVTPRRLDPREYGVLSSYGIGLTDMAKALSGSNAEISSTADDPAGLTEKLIRFKPKSLAFVGKRAAKVWSRYHLGTPEIKYGPQSAKFGEVAIYVLPSTSGLAKRFWDPLPWMEFGKFVSVLKKYKTMKSNFFKKRIQSNAFTTAACLT